MEEQGGPLGSIGCLPNELLIAIFRRLDLKYLLRCRQVCTTLRNIIQDSLDLQYVIECAATRTVDRPSKTFTVDERLKRLRDQQAAWKSFRYTKQYSIPATSLGSTISGNLLAQQIEKRSIQFHQLPSLYRNIPTKEWFLQLEYDAYSFTVDHSQSLLVAVEDVPGGDIIVHFLSCFTGGPHPEASVSRLTVHHGPDYEEPRWYHQLKVCGSRFGIMFMDTFPDDDTEAELWIWNWREGVLEMNVYGQAQRWFAFADERFVLITTLNVAGSSAQHRMENSIVVLDCQSFANTASGKRTELANAMEHAVLQLQFPERVSNSSEFLDAHIDTHFASTHPPPDLDVPFHRDSKYNAIALTLSTRNDPDFSVTGSKFAVLIPDWILRERIEARLKEISTSQGSPSPLSLPWSEWSLDTLAIKLEPPTFYDQFFAFDMIWSSHYALLVHKRSGYGYNVAIHDLDPLPMRRELRSLSDDEQSKIIKIGSHINDLVRWKEAIHTRWPHRDEPSVLSMDSDDIDFILTQDCLIVRTVIWAAESSSAIYRVYSF